MNNVFSENELDARVQGQQEQEKPIVRCGEEEEFACMELN